jgi:hypothetical protein
MFWKRKPRPAPPPPPDPERAALEAALAERQEAVAALELDLLNSRLELAEFSAELERRLGPLQRRLEVLEADLAEARRLAARRMLYGEDAASPDLPDDSVAQYQRVWGLGPAPDPPPPPPRPPEPDPAAEADLKRLYRLLARRHHPDLTTNPAEKERRAAVMAKVNAAYSARDQAALRRLAEAPAAEPLPAAPPAPKTRATILAELRAEIERLDALALALEQELDVLAASPSIRLKLDAVFARRAGRDLLADMAADLQAAIQRAEGEITALR